MAVEVHQEDVVRPTPEDNTASGAATTEGMYFSTSLKCWIVEGYAEAVAAMRETALEIPRLALPTEGLGEGERTALQGLWEQAQHLPLYSTGRAHQRLRRHLRAPFTRDAVVDWRGLTREIARELMEERLAVGRVEVVSEIGSPLVRWVMADVIGIPVSKRADFERWTEATTRVGSLATPHWSGDVAAEAAEAAECIHELVRDVLANPNEVCAGSLLGRAAHGPGPGEHSGLSVAELAANARSLYTAGVQTTIFLIASAACLIFNDEDLVRRVREDARTVKAMVQETLRFACPAVEVNVRRAGRDVTIGAHHILRGQFVRIVALRANRDSRRFRDPDVFNYRRGDRGKALAFGTGPHVCLGNHLATAVTEEICAVLAEPRYDARTISPYPQFRRRAAAPVMWGPEWVHLGLGTAHSKTVG
ncbi:cytochrome P450 [Kitasatospora sp. NPDC008050]|uniref:cytochrome P450 n=1 Tax=Kitasatospora sp. NPDC008050 TaxID=3364021 RepID=UPI0036E51EC6